MSDRFDISRRAVLHSLTAAGLIGAAAGAGAGTRAFLVDTESIHSNATAGTLDLALAATTGRGTDLDVDDFESMGTVAVPIVPEREQSTGSPTIEPSNLGSNRGVSNSGHSHGGQPHGGSSNRYQSSGQSTIGVSVCGNPASVWIRPRIGDDWSETAARELTITVTYQKHCGQDEEVPVYSGSLERFVSAYSSTGTRLGDSSRCLGRIERDELPHSGHTDWVTIVGGTRVRVRSHGTGRTPTSIDILDSDVPLCRVDVKGGGKRNVTQCTDGGLQTSGNPEQSDGSGVNSYELDCTRSASGLESATKNGHLTEISHVDLYACTDNGCQSPGCIGEGEYGCLTLDWEYTGETDATLSLSLEFFATQCRHETGTSPWEHRNSDGMSLKATTTTATQTMTSSTTTQTTTTSSGAPESVNSQDHTVAATNTTEANQ